MSKRSKTLIIALGILVFLGGGYYTLTIREKKQAESPAYPPPIMLGNLESAGLVKIAANSFTLEKTGDIWELSYLEGGIPPGGIELDQYRIQLLAFTLASVRAERVVDEAPERISVYGLDPPSFRTLVTDSAGRNAEYLLGDMTPSRTSYYVMEAGDPKVYTVSTANGIQAALDDLRQRNLFPPFELPDLKELRIETAETWMEDHPMEIHPMEIRPREPYPHLAASFAAHVLVSPYKVPRGVSSEALDPLIAALKRLVIEDFIDDNPQSLAPYGLDKPVRVFFQAGNAAAGVSASLDLLIGSEVNGKRYAKLADASGFASGVFTLGGVENIVNVKPFSLIEKFILLVNIDTVDRLVLRGGEKPLDADIRRNEASYFLNGRKAGEESFKTFYQAVISLLADAEFPGAAAAAQGGQGLGEITVEYRLNTPPGGRASFTLVPYNRDFYAVQQEGAVEFLVSRNQVRRVYETADAVVYE